MSLKAGYGTRLGAGGLKLATGARQKIGIGRALLSEPFLLILDESTASLDPETADSLNAAVRKSMKGRTCVLVVHRALMARDLDRVAVMSEGRVVEQGRHDELLVRPQTLYREIFGKQYGEERLPPVKEA
jgi:ABC-type multidrug transport system fused ATPase/permease subunit